jgi:hypothetical protein
MAVTPLDVVKCNIQVDPKKYGGIGQGFGIVAREQGMAGLVRGWVPTLLGYSAQGSLKFGLYEYFKKWVLFRQIATTCCPFPGQILTRSLLLVIRISGSTLTKLVRRWPRSTR